MLKKTRGEDYYPILRRPLLMRVMMVCGHPASGKSTFVEKNKKQGDIVFDLDEIQAELTGRPAHSRQPGWALSAAIATRNRRLEALQSETNKGQTLWFVACEARSADRLTWKKILKPEKTYILRCGRDVCFARIEGRKLPTELERLYKAAAIEWNRDYSPLDDEIVLRTDEP